MRGWSSAYALSLMVLGAGLAGCIGSPDPAPGAGDDLDPGTNETPSNVTETPDGRGTISAFRETNATEKGSGGRHHDHDYWNGRTRAVIFDQGFGLIPLPLTPRNMPPGTAIADFNVPAPNLVYEGTSQLEVLFSNVTAYPTRGGTVPGVQHPHVNIHVWYLTAADNPGEWRDAGRVTPNQPLVIPVKPLETDMPHSVASLWLFRVFTDEPNGFFTRNLTITAVKGDAVAKWPPHPDLYANGPQRVIFDGPAETRVQPATDYFLYGEDSNWFYPEKVISWGTDKLVVDVQVTGFETTVPGITPAHLYLDYHNASFAPKIGNGGTSGGSAKDEASDGTTFRFEIPVDEYGFDSPYATASRWAFRMLAAFDEQGLEELNDSLFCANCVGYTIKYNLKIVAVGHSTSGEEDMMEEPPEEEEEAGSGDGAGRGSGALDADGEAGFRAVARDALGSGLGLH